MWKPENIISKKKLFPFFLPKMFLKIEEKWAKQQEPLCFNSPPHNMAVFDVAQDLISFADFISPY